MPSGFVARAPVLPAGERTASNATAVVPGTTTDFDLHGLVGIRLVGATGRDRATVLRQVGPIMAPLHREPDIVIRFVDRLTTQSPMRILSVGESAYSDDAFFILRAKHKAPTTVRIDFDTIGKGCEIVCEHDVPAVPLLIAIVNLTVLARGGLALHASAFRYQGTTALVTGWSKGGKTELLLGFIEQGAEYIGDEWIYISEDGNRMFGMPEPIRVWDWHLDQLPRYRRHAGLRDRLKLATLRPMHAVTSAIADGAASRRVRGLRRLRPLADLIDRQRYSFLRPERAFGRGFGALSGAIDRVIFVANSAALETSIAPVSPAWIADRMVFSLQEERSALAAYYRRFRFAFPDRRSNLIEDATDVERARLRVMLEGRPCYALYHPYPPSIAALFRTAAPLFRAE